VARPEPRRPCARLAFADRWDSELRGFADGDLTPDERIDRDLLLSELAALRFDETELREDAWDALGYVYLLGGGIFPLLARDFAPLATRLTVRGVAPGGRAGALPPPARAGEHPGRPPSRLHTEMAIKQLPGIVALAEDAVAQAEAAADQPGVAELLPRLRAAARTAVAAIAAFEAWLRVGSAGRARRRRPARRRSVRPQAAPHVPLGPDRRRRSWPRPASSTTPSGAR
jgi:hypothetical protein